MIAYDQVAEFLRLYKRHVEVLERREEIDNKLIDQDRERLEILKAKERDRLGGRR